MSKIIIGIHGLGNKPSHELLEKWWKDAISEGLSHINTPHKLFKFELVSWSDLLYSEPESIDFIKEPYIPASNWIKPESDGRRKKFQKFIEEQLEKLLINPNGTINFSYITDKLIHRYFRDLELYYSDELNIASNKSIRDSIREKLFNVLLKYRNHEIMLIAHSMGSIIAFDVLKKYNERIKINTFVTIGSPLGLPIITSKIIKEFGDKSFLSVPQNISNKWLNFSDLEDKVAINFDLSDDYLPSGIGVKVEDFEIYNNYQVGKERNPHKAYGYLRAPELAYQIDKFLMAGKNRINVWLIRKVNKMIEKF